MSQPPTKYVTKLGDDDGRWDYLHIPLPREIEKFDQLEPELKKIHKVYRENLNEREDVDKKKALFPKLITSEKTGEAEPVFLNLSSEETDDDPNYIRIYFERNGRHGRVIKSKGTSENIPDKDEKERYLNKDWLIEDVSYYMRIPVEFTKHNENSPLHGFEDESCVVLEVDQENNEMRIYSPEGYRSRDAELKRKGRKPTPKTLSYTGLSLSLIKTYADLAGIGTQKFRIIPYDALHEIFEEDPYPITGENQPPRPLFRQEIKERDQLPRYQPEKLIIEWEPDPSIEFSTEGGIRQNQIHRIYTGENVDELEVHLPRKGNFIVSTTTTYGEFKEDFYNNNDLDENGLFSFSIGEDELFTFKDEWNGNCLQNPKDRDHLTAYIPCQSR